jgi:hypothetical protein
LPYARPTPDPVGAIVHPGEDLSRKTIDRAGAFDCRGARPLLAAARHASPGASWKKERVLATSTVRTFAPSVRASAPAGRGRVSPVIHLP